MINLSDDDIQKYQQIYKEQFGKEISKQEAYEQGHNLIGFFKVLLEWDRKAEKEAKIASKN